MTATLQYVETKIKPVNTTVEAIAILTPPVRASARSSTDRATGFYPVGWGFDSLRAHFCKGNPPSIGVRGELAPMFLLGALGKPVMTNDLSCPKCAETHER